MASEKQILANRRNAKRSTGPKSAAGLRRSARSNLRHGISAKQLVVEGEDPAEFDDLHERYLAEFAPLGPVEERLVFDLTVNDWRARRAHRYEAQLVPELVREPEPYEPASWARVEVAFRLSVRAENGYYRALEMLREIQGARETQIIIPTGAPSRTLAIEETPEDEAADPATAQAPTQ